MNPYLDSKHLVDITFQNLSVKVQTKNGEKQLLNNLSGICKSQEVTAILGSSGAGKTTLLNVLSNRISNTKSCKVEGQVLANNTPIDFKNFSNYASYVMQNDVLLETMTVKECLLFAANLKLDLDQQQKNQVVADLLKDLMLEKCQNTFVGGQFVKGITNGERKRTSIAYELATNPIVLMLDEPTSGLDSFAAYVLICQLRNYAKSKKKTIVFTIHSPSSDIWQLFDRILLLVEGNFIYQGQSNEAIINHFSSIGFECPRLQNPAGNLIFNLFHINKVIKLIQVLRFLFIKSSMQYKVQKKINQIDKIILIKPEQKKSGSQKQIQEFQNYLDLQINLQKNQTDFYNLIDYFLSIMHNNQKNKQNFPIYFDAYEENQSQRVLQEVQDKNKSEINVQKYKTTFFYQIFIIARRAQRNFNRNPVLLRSRIIQAIVMGILVGLVYLQQENYISKLIFYILQIDGSNEPTSQRAMRDRTGLLFFVCINQFMMSLSPCLVSFPAIRGIFLREQNSKLYDILPYFIGRILVELIPQIISPLLYGLIQFWMIGLNDSNAGNVLFYLFILILQSVIGLGLGYLCGALFGNEKLAVILHPSIYLSNLLFGGYFKNRKDFASWIGWLEYIFPQKYAFNALCQNEFENTEFTPNPVEILNLEFSKWNAAYILIGFFFAYLAISYLILVLMKKKLQ